MSEWKILLTYHLCLWVYLSSCSTVRDRRGRESDKKVTEGSILFSAVWLLLNYYLFRGCEMSEFYRVLNLPFWNFIMKQLWGISFRTPWFNFPTIFCKTILKNSMISNVSQLNIKKSIELDREMFYKDNSWSWSERNPLVSLVHTIWGRSRHRSQILFLSVKPQKNHTAWG